jgi:hypothetical protein
MEKHEQLRNEILNNSNIPQDLKDRMNNLKTEFETKWSEEDKWINDNLKNDKKIMKKTIEITEEELKDLKLIRNYFGEHDKTQLEHLAYSELDKLIKKLQQAVVIDSKKIELTTDELFNLLKEAYRNGYAIYDIVDAGLEPYDADGYARWILGNILLGANKEDASDHTPNVL